jgi:hypothetical protein
MRPVLAFSIGLVVCVAPAFGAAPPSKPVTLVLQFDNSYSEASRQQMEHELSTALRPAGLSFAYRLRSDFSMDEAVAELVVVRFTGDCDMSAKPESLPPPQARDPLAITHASRQDMLPFAEVSCDRVRSLITPWLDHNDDAQGMLGRALGRVVAHELCHVLGNSAEHSGWGVMQARLSGRDLTANLMPVDRSTINRLQKAMAARYSLLRPGD